MHVFFGIDCGHAHHDAWFLAARGQALRRITVTHTADGLTQLDRARTQFGIARAQCQVGLQTAHTLLLDFVWDQGSREVGVSPAGAIKRARRR